MLIHTDKKTESKSESAVNHTLQKKSNNSSGLQLEDNRPQTVTQLKKQKTEATISNNVIQLGRKGGGGGKPQGRGGKGKSFAPHSGKGGRGKMPMTYKPQYRPKPKKQPKQKPLAPLEFLGAPPQQVQRGVQALPPGNLRGNLPQAAAPREETVAEKIERLKRQYTHPSEADRKKNIALDETEEKETTALLMESLSKVIPKAMLSEMSFRELEFEYAQLTYSHGSLRELDSMRGYKVTPKSGLTLFDLMRQDRIAPKKNATEIYKSAEKEKHLKALMPKLSELSAFIRLTNYYDADAEQSILESGRLQSKERRIKKAKGQAVPNKSSKMDDALGNTDHVFFFAEYEDEKEHAKFRKTRFGGDPDESDAVLHQKAKLDGTERRVSFPLNSMPMAGMHGYVSDLNSRASLNPVHDVFTSRAHGGAAAADGAAAAAVQVQPAPGAHFLMDLLRQRFTQANFPGKKSEADMAKDLLAMNMRDLYEFLFRKHPKKAGATPVNPQILVPGSVSFQTPGVRFDTPTKEDIEGSEQ